MIGELEDAVVARIKAAQQLSIWPYKIPTIESYGGQISEDSQSTFRFPAVFVAFLGWKRKMQAGERTRIITVHLNLYIAARNPRNERATRQGDAHEVGSYQMVEDMIALLENQTLGFPMSEPLNHTAVETLFVSRKSDGANAESVLVVPFQCDFGWEAALPESAELTEDIWLRTGQTFYLEPGSQAELSAVINHADQ